MSNQSERRYRMLNQRQCADLIHQSSFSHPAAKPAEPQQINTLPTKRYCKIWMINRLDDFMDCGEVQATQLVEAFNVEHPQCDHWLDDSTHWIWDLPIDLENEME